MSDPVFRAMEKVPQLPDIGGIEINTRKDAQAKRPPVVGQDLIDGDVDEDEDPAPGPSAPTPRRISMAE